MDFSYDNEQTALREAVAGLLTKAYGGDERRTVTRSEPGFDEATWGRLAEMGVLGLPFAEADGGMGAGPVEVALVATEMGKVLAPEPFVETVVLAGGLIAALGTETQRTELLTAIAEGTSIVVLAHAEPGLRWSPSAGSVTAEQSGDSWTLTGVKEPVPHGARADSFVVSARTADGATQLFLVGGDAEGLTRTGYRTHDGGRAARVAFAGTPAELLGEAGGDRTADVERALAMARIAYANESVGAMDTALAMTSEYLTTRKQFGVTLNKFQALTFRAADMYVSLELARSIALWATMVADAGGDVVLAADRARLTTSRAGRHIGKEAIQLHGGIGVTAEYKVGHYTSRLTAIDHQLGDGDWALGRLAAGVAGHESVDPLS
ncbi:acyl-CoA dehydrogenase [Modestobacter sp. I12A-02628]|uniref:Acyl-CoA dehydrogenase n=1 Tax=Goekera deserti TaxID=2497753 RepID=A0A7K3WIW1_9ACTN|nr:acyl-CoA dehydrogenase family protein [Goekera deserti]MPQ97062.1 acyl-CoA dehydrogenase [Goekera deserti]NDI46621.1 acyl-CoA dehydrogenase [Goekera deserti]NEL56377.1 acyl-CoA dehydrogenase [Goekera deserti]